MKAKLAKALQSLKTGESAEILGHDGCWKVQLIYQNRGPADLRIPPTAREFSKTSTPLVMRQSSPRIKKE